MLEISLAPMLKVTTPQFRLLMRKISPSTILFTEMIVASTIIHVTKEKLKILLGSPDSNTVVQIGGSDPSDIAKSISILKQIGWEHFNLNCGCPSDRVQSGRFGAILMLDHVLVGNIINKVYEVTGVVISLKIRTGVDECDSYDFFKNFVKYISTNTKCTKFYVHARKCWLNGLNPKQNRNIPQLNYQFVYDIKTEFPHLFFSLNGGIKNNDLAKLKNLDGFMIGRYACENIMVFREYEMGSGSVKESIREYLCEAAEFNCSKNRILIPLNNLRKGKTHSKIFKQILNEMTRNDMALDQIFDNIQEFIE